MRRQHADLVRDRELLEDLRGLLEDLEVALAPYDDADDWVLRVPLGHRARDIALYRAAIIFCMVVRRSMVWNGMWNMVVALSVFACAVVSKSFCAVMMMMGVGQSAARSLA